MGMEVSSCDVETVDAKGVVLVYVLATWAGGSAEAYIASRAVTDGVGVEFGEPLAGCVDVFFVGAIAAFAGEEAARGVQYLDIGYLCGLRHIAEHHAIRLEMELFVSRWHTVIDDGLVVPDLHGDLSTLCDRTLNQLHSNVSETPPSN